MIHLFVAIGFVFLACYTAAVAGKQAEKQEYSNTFVLSVLALLYLGLSLIFMYFGLRDEL